MSKKIYVCKKFLYNTIEAIGTTKVTNLSNDDLAAKENGLSYSVKPDVIQLNQSVTIEIQEASKINANTSDHPTYIVGLSVQFKNNNSNVDYLASAFYQKYKEIISLNFPLYINYSHEGIDYYKTIFATKQGSLITQGNKSYIANIAEQFDNIAFITDVGENVALSFIEVKAGLDTPTILRNDGEVLTTAIAIECLKTTSNMVVENIVGEIIEDTTVNVLCTGTIPDSSQMGRIFLTYLDVTEIGGVHCLTSYKDPGGDSLILSDEITKPYPRKFIRTDDVYYSTFEYFGGMYRGTDFYEMYGQSSDTVGSSYEDDIIHKLDDNQPLRTNSTDMNWYDLRSLSWFDSAYIRCTFKPSGRSSGWVPLSKCFFEGIRVMANEETVDIELALPDLCSLLNTSFDGSVPITSDHFLGGFYPKNPLNITIELGYQTGYADSYYTTKDTGLYIDKSKVRRLFIGDKEVQYFIIDNETTS